MAAPTMTTIAKAATAANATTLVLTLTAAVPAGTAACVFVRVSAVLTSVVDTRSNVWTTNNISSSGSMYIWTTVVTTPLQIGDTITLSFSSNTVAAIAVKFAGQGQSLNPTSGGVGGVLTSGVLNTATSTAVALAAGNVLAAPGAEALAIFVAGIMTGVVAGDFSSVDSGYTIADSQFTTGTGTQRALALCTKSLAVASPMPTQNPTVTLANSRLWNCALVYALAATDRGAHADDPFGGDFAAAVAVRGALGSPSTFGQIKKINGLIAVRGRDGLL